MAGTHQGLHDGVVGGVHVGVEREGALALAVVRRVALRSDDPVLRAEKRALKQEEVGTRWGGGVATTAVRSARTDVAASFQAVLSRILLVVSQAD